MKAVVLQDSSGDVVGVRLTTEQVPISEALAIGMGDPRSPVRVEVWTVGEFGRQTVSAKRDAIDSEWHIWHGHWRP